MSEEPSLPIASTSASSSSLSTRKGKRRATADREFFSHVSPPPLPSPSPSSSSPKEPLPKKARKERIRKPKVKKVAVWKDIQPWKEGDDPLGRFPLEVLDLIISVHSDLDLRDHLALAATCRYFRTCYRDVVFHVLFQAAFPRLARYSVAKIDTSNNGNPWFIDAFYPNQPQIPGPFERSFKEARRIFSSGRSLVGAGGWTGWGLSRTEYDANKKDAEKQKEVLSSALAQYWDDRPVVVETDEDQTDEELGREYWGEGDWDDLSEERKEEFRKSQQKIELEHALYLRRSARAVLRDVHVLDPDPADQPLFHTVIYRPVSRQVNHDAWPSEWRAKVAEVVLGPSINKTNAKTQYKVSDQELLGLKERTDGLGATRNSTWYYRAAVEALSLRSHGGINGHAEHLAKLEARKEKAHATRVKNGTVEPSYST